MADDIKELALNGAVTEALCLVEELKVEAEGWRRRNLIADSLMERQERVIARLEAIAAAWEGQLAILTDLDRIDVKLRRLNLRVLSKDSDNKTGERRRETSEFAKRFGL